jgi:hypothetical protein
MATEVNVITKQRRTTVQAIIGEAIDLWIEADDAIITDSDGKSES